MTLRIANAPCSWGSLEFDDLDGEAVPWDRMLDELVATGYAGTELGDPGFLPGDPETLHAELTRRGIFLLGAFVPVAFAVEDRLAEGRKEALEVARLLAGVADRAGAGAPRPFVVIADDNGTVAERTKHAGRVPRSMMLSDDEWTEYASNAEDVARVVADETGLRTVFHHHCAGWVETPQEIESLLDRTDPELLGVVFDTGHFAFGAGAGPAAPGRALQFLERYGDRVPYLHFKDCDPRIAQAVRDEELDYFEAVRRGVFCELGKGCVDFSAMLEWCRLTDFDGWVVVEQDVLPGLGTPRESAQRNREYLRSLGV